MRRWTIKLKSGCPGRSRFSGFIQTVHSTAWLWCDSLLDCLRYNLNEVTSLDSEVKRIGVEQMLLEVENYWSAWLNRLRIDLNILPREVARLFKRSLLLMRAHVDNHGGFLASLDSDIMGIHRDTYSYVWPRDGSMAALAFSSAGFTDVPAMFFGFCNQGHR